MADQTKVKFTGGPLNGRQIPQPDDVVTFTIPHVGDSGIQEWLTYRDTGRRTGAGHRVFELPPGHGA